MGHRFVPNCSCLNPVFRIAEKGQTIQCDSCDAPMAYEWWDRDPDLFAAKLLGAVEHEKVPAIKPPTEGWKDADDISFTKWYRSPEY